MKIEIGPYPSDDSVFDKQYVSVHIDRWDTWNMDHTLAHIILPMLKQLKKEKHGSPFVDLEDVPEELQLHGHASSETLQYDLFESEEHDSLVWDAMHARWDWVINEMIFAFECLAGKHQDWEEQFWSSRSNDEWVPKQGIPVRKWDKEGHVKWASRMENGFRLFGKYYRGLWD